MKITRIGHWDPAKDTLPRPHLPRPARFDVFLVAGAAFGTLGFYLVWPPLAPLFLAAVLFVLAALVDRRTEVAP